MNDLTNKMISVRNSVFYMIIILALFGCNKSKNNITGDLNNQAGAIEIHRCFCSASAYRYLIVIYNGNEPTYYNPINLAEDYKDKNYGVVFSADLLNDSSIVYTNLANDALVEAFKVRNVKLIAIEKTTE